MTSLTMVCRWIDYKFRDVYSDENNSLTEVLVEPSGILALPILFVGLILYRVFKGGNFLRHSVET